MFRYVCPRGHSQGVWRDEELKMAVEAARDPFIRKCHCGRDRKLQQYHVAGPNVIADIPPHFNSAFGREVRSRRHLKDLQRQTGASDFEPDRETRDRFREGQLRSELARGR